MNRLQDKVAVVTGATSGIGEAVAVMYAKEGASVVLVGRNSEKGEATAVKIREDGGDAVFVRCDVTKRRIS